MLFYMSDEDHITSIKKELQNLLFIDGTCAYLNKEELDSVIRIAVEEEINEELLKNVIQTIDKNLKGQIDKVYDEVTFYQKFSSLNPFKRLFNLAWLSIQYILCFLLFIIFCYSLITKTYIVVFFILLPLLIVGSLLKLYLFFKKK